MATEPQSQLTTKDHAILQTMLERYRGPHGPFIQLLERKVRSSAVCFRDDIPPRVVTLNTRFTYRVDGMLAGPHLVVQGEGKDLPSFALSIHTIRGLALLGLAERAPVTVFPGHDAEEELCVEDVLSQPEAAARTRETERGCIKGDAARRTENVLSFPGKQTWRPPSGPCDDDDPGPRAA